MSVGTHGGHTNECGVRGFRSTLPPSPSPTPWRTPDHCRHPSGGGDHAPLASLQAGVWPPAACPGPLSPRNGRLGCLSPRRRAWAREWRGRSEGVSHPRCALKIPRESFPPAAFPTARPAAFTPGAPQRGICMKLRARGLIPQAKQPSPYDVKMGCSSHPHTVPGRLPWQIYTECPHHVNDILLHRCH